MIELAGDGPTTCDRDLLLVCRICYARCCRDSSAFFLVKWLGREKWDVSWEDSKTLDTAWCRCTDEATPRPLRMQQHAVSPSCHIPPPPHSAIRPSSRCRKLTRAFVAAEPVRRAVAPLLPPSHPLVDRIRTRIEVCPPPLVSGQDTGKPLVAVRGANNTGAEAEFQRVASCGGPSDKEVEQAAALFEHLQACFARQALL